MDMDKENGALKLGKYFSCALFMFYVVEYMLSPIMTWWTSSARLYGIR